MREDYIRTEQLAVGYGSQVLIRQIELHVKRGQIVTLIGPNGSGKSTILKSIIRHIRPLGGAVCLDGRSMKDMTEREIGRRMSILMTDRVRPEAMTCREVAAAGRYPHTGRFGILSREDRKKVDEALAMVQASDLADQEFARVSDGQKAAGAAGKGPSARNRRPLCRTSPRRFWTSGTSWNCWKF